MQVEHLSVHIRILLGMYIGKSHVISLIEFTQPLKFRA